MILKQEKEELEKIVNDMRQKYDMLERRAAELQETEERKHEEEVNFLKKTNLQLKVQFKFFNCAYPINFFLFFFSETTIKEQFVPKLVGASLEVFYHQGP